jgi:hypothetical protein
MTANAKEPTYLDITWVSAALEREYKLQGIIPGQPIKVSYAKLLGYCPQEVINAVNSNGHPDFYAISVCLDLAENDGLIIVERTGAGYSYKSRRMAYRLPPSHPMVRKASRVTSTGKLLSVVSQQA